MPSLRSAAMAMITPEGCSTQLSFLQLTDARSTAMRMMSPTAAQRKIRGLRGTSDVTEMGGFSSARKSDGVGIQDVFWKATTLILAEYQQRGRVRNSTVPSPASE